MTDTSKNFRQYSNPVRLCLETKALDADDEEQTIRQVSYASAQDGDGEEHADWTQRFLSQLANHNAKHGQFTEFRVVPISRLGDFMEEITYKVSVVLAKKDLDFGLTFNSLLDYQLPESEPRSQRDQRPIRRATSSTGDRSHPHTSSQSAISVQSLPPVDEYPPAEQNARLVRISHNKVNRIRAAVQKRRSKSALKKTSNEGSSIDSRSRRRPRSSHRRRSSRSRNSPTRHRSTTKSDHGRRKRSTTGSRQRRRGRSRPSDNNDGDLKPSGDLATAGIDYRQIPMIKSEEVQRMMSERDEKKQMKGSPRSESTSVPLKKSAQTSLAKQRRGRAYENLNPGRSHRCDYRATHSKCVDECSAAPDRVIDRGGLMLSKMTSAKGKTGKGCRLGAGADNCAEMDRQHTFEARDCGLENCSSSSEIPPRCEDLPFCCQCQQ